MSSAAEAAVGLDRCSGHRLQQPGAVRFSSDAIRLNAGGSVDRPGENREDFLCRWTRTSLPRFGLYPSLALSTESLRRSRGDDLIENRTDWGLDVKITRVVSWAGITIGYRAPFRTPFGGWAILGVSVILQPY